MQLIKAIALVLFALPLTGCIDNYMKGGGADGSPPPNPSVNVSAYTGAPSTGPSASDEGNSVGGQLASSRPNTSSSVSNGTTSSGSSGSGNSSPSGCVDRNSYGATSCETGRAKTEYVSGYYRKDGTYVKGYYRS